MILVTGGAGFIGSVLVSELVARAIAPVVVCDRFGAGDKWRNLAGCALADAVAPDALAGWLETNGGDIDCVLHLGASSSTTEPDVDFVLRNNFTASLDLWRWCAARGVRFIYASSAAVYGDGSAGFEDDTDPTALAALRPLNAYGWSKLLFDAEAVRRAAAGTAPPQWAGLRFFNVYGPNEDHKGAQRSVVVQLYEQIAASGRARLFRSHHPDYPDGGQKRDFIWVGDCVDVVLWLYAHPEVSGIFNCGTGDPRTFEDLARATFSALGADVAIDYVDTPAEIRDQYQYFTEAPMARLRRAGYNADFTALEDGVSRYVKDYLAGSQRYR